LLLDTKADFMTSTFGGSGFFSSTFTDIAIVSLTGTGFSAFGGSSYSLTFFGSAFLIGFDKSD
jgi:hypothetical protein